MKPRISVGKYAAVPYCLETLKIRVYCLEELVYCFRENAFLLDADIMSDTLLNWIKEECKEEDLEKELYSLVHQTGSLSAFVICIMEYVGFYEKEIIEQVEETLRESSGLNKYEKKKKRVDYFTENRRYLAALEGYNQLLQEWEEKQKEGEEKGLEQKDLEFPENYLSNLLHNKGVALAGLMQYEKAAEAFLKAYEYSQNSKSFQCYLAALQMQQTEKSVIDLATQVNGSFEDAHFLEKKMQKLQREWEEGESSQYLQQRKALHEENIKQYYKENSRLISALKETYRKECFEGS